MNMKIMGPLLALAIGLTAQAAQAATSYSDALAYSLSSKGVVMGRSICGGQFSGIVAGPCDKSWRQVDNDASVKFIQAGGNVLFEVYATGQIWMTLDAFRVDASGNRAVAWLNAGIDATVTSPTQLSVGRSEINVPGDINIYKVSNKKLFKMASSGTAWQELTAFGAKGEVTAVSGDFVAIKTAGTGLSTLFHIATGQQVIDRQYGVLVGTLDESVGSSSNAYLARFIPGTLTNQESVISTYGGNPQYGPAFTFTDLKGLAVAATDPDGPNSAFLLLPRSTTPGDNNVLMVNENTAPFTGNNHAGVVVRAGLSSGIAAATSYEPFGARMRSFLWVLKPSSTGGDVFEFKCSTTSCGFVTQPPRLSSDPYTQVVATTNWVAGDPF